MKHGDLAPMLLSFIRSMTRREWERMNSAANLIYKKIFIHRKVSTITNYGGGLLLPFRLINDDEPGSQ